MPRRTVADPRFPARLRELREQRGLSLRALEVRAYSSRSHLHQFETGGAVPSLDTVRRLDEVLGAGGTLAAMVTAAVPDTVTGDDLDRVDYAVQHPRRVDAATVGVLADLLAGQRRLEDVVGSAPMLPVASTHLALVSGLVQEACGTVRPALVDMAAQWAQFNGWLNLSADRRTEADSLFTQALAWAVEVDGREMVATALSFKGHAAFLAGEVGALIGLAEAALRDPTVYVGQRAYEHHQLARGYAMAGEPCRTLDTLARGVDLAAEAVEFTGPRPPWHYYRSPASYVLERGTVYRLLGEVDPMHNRTAIGLLTDGLADLPADVRGAEWAAVYRVHLVHAYVQDGDRASALGELARVRTVAEATCSPRLRADVHGLSAALSTDRCRQHNGSGDARRS